MENKHSEFPLTMQAFARLEQVIGQLDENVGRSVEERQTLLQDLEKVRFQNESLQESTQIVTARLDAAIGRLQSLLKE